MSARSDLEADLPPEQLVPGDLETLEAMAANASVFADQIADTRRGVQSIQIDGGDWSGDAADVYRAAKDVHTDSLSRTITAFDEASKALMRYAKTLRDSRESARVARDEFRAAKKREEAAAALAARAQNTPPSRTSPFPQVGPEPLPFASLRPTGPIVECPPTTGGSTPMSRPGLAGMVPVGRSSDDCVKMLIEARHEVELAGDAAAQALVFNTGAAPPVEAGPSVKDVVEAPGHFAHGLWTKFRTVLPGLAYTGTPQGAQLAHEHVQGDAELTPAMTTMASVLMLFAGTRSTVRPSAAPPVPIETPGAAPMLKVLELGPAADQVLAKETAALAERHGMTPAELEGLNTGKGPYLRGLAGENAVAKMAEDAGYTVLTRQPTVVVEAESGAVRVKPDLLVESPEGEVFFVDVKSGPSSHLTPNQSVAYDLIRSDGFVPRGQNALNGGLPIGVAHKPIPVWEVYLRR